MAPDHTVIAKIGRVTGRIAPGTLGEVLIPIRGGNEAFNAYAIDANTVIEVGARVIVVEQDSSRTVRVQPY
jgi:sporulation protein YlmC with PRC-barrel domain